MNIERQLLKLATMVWILCFSIHGNAATAPLSVSIVPGIQYPASDYIIAGLRLGVLWGNQTEVYGLDIGAIGNVTQTAFAGSALGGVFNLNKGSANVYGLQIAGLGNFNMGATIVKGLQFAVVSNYNPGDATIYGLQFSLLNLGAGTKIYGFQVGLFNEAAEVYGMQIGFINSAKSLHGIQIGFLNYHEAGFFQVSPLINIGF